MLRLLQTIVLLILCASKSASAQGPKDSAIARDYLPTVVGTKLVYRDFRDGKDTDYETTKLVTEFEQGSTFAAVTISSSVKYKEIAVPIVDGKPQEPGYDVFERPAYRYLLTHDRIFCVAEVGAKKDLNTDDGPTCFFKLPAKAGVQWSYGSPTGVFHTSYTIGKLERITVPAGTFEAIPVYRKTSYEGKVTPSVNYWYAKGIGCIKTDLEGYHSTELKSIERPRSYVPPTSPKDLFKKSIAARGGTNGPQHQQMVHIVAEGIEFEGNDKIPIALERWDLGLSRQRNQVTKTKRGRKSVEVSVLDKDRAWSKVDDKPAKPIIGVELEIFRKQVDSAELTLQELLDDRHVELSMAGERFRGGEPCWCVLVRRPGASNQILSFSKKTYLLMAKSSSVKSDDGETTMEGVYSDYRKLGDGLMAYRHETFENYRLIARLEIKKMTPVKTLDEKLLAMPK